MMIKANNFILLNGMKATSSVPEHSLSNGVVSISSARIVGEFIEPKTLFIPLTSIAVMY